jgi:hypothetical protein
VKNEEVLQSQGGEEYPTYSKQKEGYILRMNFLLGHVTEGKIRGKDIPGGKTTKET